MNSYEKAKMILNLLKKSNYNNKRTPNLKSKILFIFNKFKFFGIKIEMDTVLFFLTLLSKKDFNLILKIFTEFKEINKVFKFGYLFMIYLNSFFKDFTAKFLEKNEKIFDKDFFKKQKFFLTHIKSQNSKNIIKFSYQSLNYLRIIKQKFHLNNTIDCKIKSILPSSKF